MLLPPTYNRKAENLLKESDIKLQGVLMLQTGLCFSVRNWMNTVRQLQGMLNSELTVGFLRR